MKKNLSLCYVLASLLSTATAYAEVCKSTCNTYCKKSVFRESRPDQFTPQKCSDYGGNGGGLLSDGSYLCTKSTSDNLTVSGWGAFTHSAQKSTYDNCMRLKPYCDLESRVSIGSGYICE